MVTFLTVWVARDRGYVKDCTEKQKMKDSSRSQIICYFTTLFHEKQRYPFFGSKVECLLLTNCTAAFQ